jgi:hypothetical protein
MTTLADYAQIQTALFCRMDVPDYAVLYFSSFNRAVTINGESYTPLGNLLSVSESASELRINQSQLSISISGIPDTSIAEILDNRIKGSAIKVWRVYFDAVTGELLNVVDNPAGRFQGIVNNYSLEEEWNESGSSNTILLTCSSSVDLLANKVSGRRTNPNDQRALYPDDVSMDRVLSLANSNFNFGAPV